MIGVQQYAGLSLVVLGSLLAAAQNWPTFYHKVREEKSSACQHSCLEKKTPQLVSILVRPTVDKGL
jgi:hypothetical protein